MRSVTLCMLLLGALVPSARALELQELGADWRGAELFAGLEVADDAGGEWTAQQVLDNHMERFGPPPSGRLPLADTTSWVLLGLRNVSQDPIAGVVQWKRSFKWGRADVFAVEGGRAVPHSRQGQLADPDRLPLGRGHVAWRVDIASGETQRWLIRVHRRATSMDLRPELRTLADFQASKVRSSALGGFFNGLFLVMALYHLLLYLGLRDRSYLLYVGVILANLFSQAMPTGSLGQLIGLDSVWLSNHHFAQAGIAMCGMWCLFSRDALATVEYAPRLDRACGVLGHAQLVLALLAGLLPPMSRMFTFFTVSSVSMVVCLLAGWLGLRAGYRPARLYLASWGVLFALVILQASSGMVDLGPLFPYMGSLGSSFQIVMFGLVLAQRFALLRAQSERAQAERLAAQAEALRIEEEAAATLQAKVDERTLELATNMDKIRRLLDSLSQGVFSFGQDMALRGNWSVAAESIFERGLLESGNVRDLLVEPMAPWDPERLVLDQWLDRAFEVSLEDFEEISQLAPSEVVLSPDSPEERTLNLEFRPVAELGQVAEVMCLVTDVTEFRRAEAQAEQRDSEQRRQIVMLQNLSGGGAEMVRFLHDTAVRLDEFETELSSEGLSLDRPVVSTLFQIAHTIKGDARLYELEHVESCSAELEETLAAVRGQIEEGLEIEVDAWREALCSDAVSLRTALAETREALVRVAPMGEAILDQVTVSKALLHELMQRSAERADDLTPLVQRLTARPFGEAVGRLVNAVPAWAARRGKQAVLEVDGRAVLVPLELSSALSSALTHLVRNAVVHGVEPPERRSELGKEPRGLVQVCCSQLQSGYEIRVRDDGGGIDRDGIRARVEAGGLPCKADLSVEELIFMCGVSTAAVTDEMAGRGVGMAAVRAELGERGYEVRVETRSNSGTEIIISPLPGSPGKARDAA